jgi:hypothetical protein
MRPCILLATASALILGACSTTPLVTRTDAMLSPSQIADMGLVCRRDRPPDTNIPRTICASKEAWAAFDERRRRETDDLMAEGRKTTNVGQFNRD